MQKSSSEPSWRAQPELEAREAYVLAIGRRIELAEREVGGVIREPAHDAVLDHVDLQVVVEDEAALHRLQHEAGGLVAPDGRLRPALDRDVLLVVQGGERVRAGRGRACARAAGRGCAPCRRPDRASNRGGLAAAPFSAGVCWASAGPEAVDAMTGALRPAIANFNTSLRLNIDERRSGAVAP